MSKKGIDENNLFYGNNSSSHFIRTFMFRYVFCAYTQTLQ